MRSLRRYRQRCRRVTGLLGLTLCVKITGGEARRADRSTELGGGARYNECAGARPGPDSIYIDGMEGAAGAVACRTEERRPGIAAIRQARKALDDVGRRGEIAWSMPGGSGTAGRREGAGPWRRAVAIGHWH